MDPPPASKQEVHDHVVQSLSEAGAPNDFCHFFADILQLEHDINMTSYRLGQSLKNYDGKPLDPNTAFKTIQELTRNFNLWKNSLDNLAYQGETIRPLSLEPGKVGGSKVLKALCSFQVDQVTVKAGDEIVITDTSQPDRLKVRTSGGSEGYVPALSCLLPAPDKSALTALHRLKIQLLASWTESVKTVQEQLTSCLASSTRALTNEWRMRSMPGNTVAKDRVGRRFKRITDALSKQYGTADQTKLHNALFSLEKELTSCNSNNSNADIGRMVDVVASLDKAVLCYQQLHRQWSLHRRELEKEPLPIRVMEQWTHIRPSKGGRSNIKYYEHRITVENTETKEETTHTINPHHNGNGDADEWSTASGARRERIETDQITTQRAEEKRTFVISGVIDPRTQQEISFQDAVKQGIVDQAKGVYVNLDSGEQMPIPQAMGMNLIKVEFQTAKKTREETSAIGLITIKTLVDTRDYDIVSAVDADSGEKVNKETAMSRTILDADCQNFTNLMTGEVLNINDAIEDGWVQVDYDPNGPEPHYEDKTYAVNAVVDQRHKRKVQFYEAIKLGLIDKNTGNYINNATGEKIYVGEAIRRGFLKAKVVDSADGLNIDAENHMVVERMDMMKNNVLKRLGVISALRKAAGLGSENATVNGNGVKNGH
jgi:hypothetical protein